MRYPFVIQGLSIQDTLALDISEFVHAFLEEFTGYRPTKGVHVHCLPCIVKYEQYAQPYHAQVH